MGYGHGRVPHDTPECPRQGVSADDGQSHWHIADVRSAQHLLEPERLAATLRERTASGELPRWFADAPNPLGFLIHEQGAHTITEAAYRFARHEPGVDVVLFGTGDAGHLRANIASLLKPPLPEADHAKLDALFGHLAVGIGLDSNQGR